mmetsp:Transcript_2233/g.5298  ORF Transcript_2233/g.5298 Transcript_2233/m.5298 type:complete len:329 (-) Transcript_2233:801-1787(-)
MSCSLAARLDFLLKTSGEVGGLGVEASAAADRLSFFTPDAAVAVLACSAWLHASSSSCGSGLGSNGDTVTFLAWSSFAFPAGALPAEAAWSSPPGSTSMALARFSRKSSRAVSGMLYSRSVLPGASHTDLGRESTSGLKGRSAVSMRRPYRRRAAESGAACVPEGRTLCNCASDTLKRLLPAGVSRSIFLRMKSMASSTVNVGGKENTSSVPLSTSTRCRRALMRSSSLSVGFMSCSPQPKKLSVSSRRISSPLSRTHTSPISSLLVAADPASSSSCVMQSRVAMDTSTLTCRFLPLMEPHRRPRLGSAFLSFLYPFFFSREDTMHWS